MLQFNNEALFQQAIAGLLRQMPDNYDVQILQGPDELGKDIVFYSRGPLGEEVVCAAVVKNVKISGNVERKSGARTVLLQAEQALDTPFIDPLGNHVPVHRVYVFSPYPVTQTALKSIQGKLKGRIGAVYFLAGQELFDAFKRHWPDFIADQASAVLGYLARAERELSDDRTLARVLDLYNIPRGIASQANVYVPASFGRVVYRGRVADLLLEAIPDAQRLTSAGGVSQLLRCMESCRRALARVEAARHWGVIDETTCYRKTLEAANSAILVLGAWATTSSKRNEELVERLRAQRRVASQQQSDALHDVERYQGSCQTALSVFRERLNEMGAEFDALLSTIDHKAGADTVIATAKGYAPALLTMDLFESEGVLTRFDERLEKIEFPGRELGPEDGAVLIVAPAGHGKTTFCRWTALRDIAAYRMGESDRLPVYVPLHRCRDSVPETLDGFIQEFATQSAFLDGADAERLKAGAVRARVYLDGLDELPAETQRSVARAVAAAAPYRGKQVVLTARDSVVGPWLNFLPRIALLGLALADQQTLVTKHLEKSRYDARHFWEAVSETPTVVSLLQVPLLATLVITSYRHSGTLPPTKRQLYESICDLLSGGWDVVKGLSREGSFTRTTKLLILKALAAVTHEARKRSFAADDVHAAAHAVLGPGAQYSEAGLMQELLMDGLIEGTEECVQFSHLSFQEYLAAAFIMGSDPGRASEALREYLRGDPWTKEMLGFYIGMSAAPPKLADTLYKVTLDEFTRAQTAEMHGEAVGDFRARAREVGRHFSEQFPEMKAGVYGLWFE
jgi:hypothetical protein